MYHACLQAAPQEGPTKHLENALSPTVQETRLCERYIKFISVSVKRRALHVGSWCMCNMRYISGGVAPCTQWQDEHCIYILYFYERVYSDVRVVMWLHRVDLVATRCAAVRIYVLSQLECVHVTSAFVNGAYVAESRWRRILFLLPTYIPLTTLLEASYLFVYPTLPASFKVNFFLLCRGAIVITCEGSVYWWMHAFFVSNDTRLTSKFY